MSKIWWGYHCCLRINSEMQFYIFSHISMYLLQKSFWLNSKIYWNIFFYNRCCFFPGANELANCINAGIEVWTKWPSLCRQYFQYIFIPPTQQSCWGVYWFHSVRPFVCLSVRPASRVRSVAPTVLVGSISYLYILSSSFRRCVVCKLSCKISRFEFLAIF